ncbi:glycosyltransferase family 4 protein [Chthonobacter albigriseus]|uniref:glycosyltransferase family 4 protein n=1 Tax=Chthonobacter albigriseus TaxID=1683161 RepID=UPI0015EF22C6|nr:glycosyltransferase family 1 protein [Chthonobacter albigriseus]
MPDPGAVTVHADLRWPAMTGIGSVMQAMIEHAPAWAKVVPLPARGGMADPFAPLTLAMALAGAARDGGVFWNPGFVPPAYSPLPSIVTVHDLTHLHYYDAKRRAYYNAVYRPLYRRCRSIVCVSAFTRDEFLAWSGVPEDRVHVVLNGVDDRFLANVEAAAPGYRYVLYPGNHRGYKNLARLVEAYARSGLPREGVFLALTGKPDAALLAIARRLGVEDNLRFLGRIPDAEMPKLYRGAEAVAFVSLYEGFGLPILEAFASDVPIVTSAVSALPEVAGDAALVVDPTDVEAIAGALDRAVLDNAERERLVAAGRLRVDGFRWGPSAARFWSIVRDAADRR